MGADETALVALSAQVHVHTRDLDGNSSLLVLAGAQRHAATRLEGADWQLVAVQVVTRLLNALGKALRRILLFPPIRGSLLAHSSALALGPFGLHFTFDDTIDARVNAINVHLDNLVTLLAIHFLDASLQQIQSFLQGHHAAQLEEDTLHNHVDALAEASLNRDLGSIDDEQFSLLVGQGLLHGGWQLGVQLVLGPSAIDDTDTARLQVAGDVVLLSIALLVDSDVISGPHIVGCLDGLGAESEVTDGDTATLLCIVLEVGLGVEVSVERKELHSTLVGTDSAIATKTVKHALCRSLGQHVQPVAYRQGHIGHIVVDANRESKLGSLALQVFVAGHHHVGCELLGSQSIPATDHNDFVASHQVECGCNLGEQRLSLGAWLLGAVQHAHTLD
mmetsp:Transcript_95195/g.199086  ORF Transcript_95195/g.199086 Transcript_95195/m.199086 type:complete len:391 (-) Transcript_95195:1291-2463(-)